MTDFRKLADGPLRFEEPGAGNRPDRPGSRPESWGSAVEWLIVLVIGVCMCGPVGILVAPLVMWWNATDPGRGYGGSTAREVADMNRAISGPVSEMNRWVASGGVRPR